MCIDSMGATAWSESAAGGRLEDGGAVSSDDFFSVHHPSVPVFSELDAHFGCTGHSARQSMDHHQ